MAVVLPCVLLDQVDQNPYQAGRPTVGPGAPGQPPPAAVGQRLVDQGAGHGVLPERPKLLGDVLRAECKSQSRLAFQSTVSHGAAGRARAATGAPRVLDVGQVLEDPRRGSSTRGRAWPPGRPRPAPRSSMPGWRGGSPGSFGGWRPRRLRGAVPGGRARPSRSRAGTILAGDRGAKGCAARDSNPEPLP
jgi:hypothetical protein